MTDTAGATASPLLKLLWSDLLEFLDQAELPNEPDEASRLVTVDYFTNPLYLSLELGCVYLFLPLFADADATPEERQAAVGFLKENVRLPAEFDGMARYQDAPYGQTGLMIEMLMPRRFSSILMADAMDLSAEVMEQVAALETVG